MSNELQVLKDEPRTPVARLKLALSVESVREQFANTLSEGASLFIASLIDVYSSDSYLQKCAPKEVIMEALKAATLRLPINKSLGFAYIIPYGNKPTFTIGYKGFIQLAMRAGQYRYINADVVREGEFRHYDKITGELDITGEPESETVVGYFAHMETVNGFRKTIFWSKEKMEAHGKKYSQSYNRSGSPWKTEFDKMAIKTVIRELLSRYGVMSIDMVRAFESDMQDMVPVRRDALEGLPDADDLNSRLIEQGGSGDLEVLNRFNELWVFASKAEKDYADEQMELKGKRPDQVQMEEWVRHVEEFKANI